MEHFGLLFISAPGHTVSLSLTIKFFLFVFFLSRPFFCFHATLIFPSHFHPLHIFNFFLRQTHTKTQNERSYLYSKQYLFKWIYKYEVTDVYVKTIAEKYIHTLIHVSFSLSHSKIHSNLGTYHVLSLKNLHYRGTYQVLIFLKLCGVCEVFFSAPPPELRGI